MTQIRFVSTLEGAPWGGSEELWTGAAIALAKRGHKVCAVVNPWPSEVTQHERLTNAGIAVSSHRQTPPAQLSLPRRVVDRLLRQHYRWPQEDRPDLVVFSLSGHMQGMLGMDECRSRGIPYAIVVQAAAEVLWPNEQGRGMAARCYESAAAVYFVSKGNAELVRGMLAISLPDAQIIDNPFIVGYDAAPAWPGDDEPLKLACVGRLHPASKGQDLILGVMSLKKWRERAVLVRLYGDGPDRLAIEAGIAANSLKSVEIAGFTKNIEAVWAANHALVLPSRYEGMPLVIIEAMLCGRACVVTDVAGNAEHIEDNVTGFVAPGVRIHHLDDAMERCWQRRLELRSIGKAAGQSIRKRISRDPCAALADQICALVQH